MRALFRDRRQAGLKLAEAIQLSDDQKANTVLIALPRGGVEVGVEISKSLQLPLDVLIVRKVGHPLYSEYGIGAVTEDDFSWLDQEALGVEKIPQATLDELFAREKKEVIRRKSEYRRDKPLVEIENKTVILIDDGLATGVTARLAARYLRFRDAQKVILAVPVCLGKTEYLRSEFDEIICLGESSQFTSVGQFFREFDQLTDAEVIALLDEVDRIHPRSYFDVRQFPKMEQLVLKNAVALKKRDDFEQIIDKVKSSQVVMLGEATHGSQEFYEWRRMISQELIEKHGFNLIAVEGDWPACAAVDRYIRDSKKEDQAYETLRSFQRWPGWMWANTEMMKLTQWMKQFNHNQSPKRQVGFYGLDIYSFFDSVDEVLRILAQISPEMEKKARDLYSCLNRFDRNEKSYARSLHQEPEGCSQQVVEVLKEVLQLKVERHQASQLFAVQQNARIVRNAEQYYSAIIHGTAEGWNIRDRHMFATLKSLLDKQGVQGKAIVWAHNSHIGDHQSAMFKQSGQVNLGGLAREEWGKDLVSLIGFGTYRGEVIASKAWDGPTAVLPVPPARESTYEHIFHHAAVALKSNSFFLWLKEDLQNSELKKAKGHRGIGVVYNPIGERRENDQPVSLTERYDGFLFVDQTHALTPLKQKFQRKDIPETWPIGF